VLRSGLVVEVPEVESAVGAQRGRLDPHARLGVPPHVTALFPFVPPELIDGHILDRVRSVVRGVPAFDYRITHSAWFGDDVLWLAPQDDRLFRTLTALLSRAFPDYPPYGGEHADPVPHLTVADHAALADMRTCRC
jgi:2'-5' RNA ligase